MLPRKFFDVRRPYRVWGYPVIPAIFAVVYQALCANTLVFYTPQSLAGLSLLISGIPVYILSQKSKRRQMLS